MNEVESKQHDMMHTERISHLHIAQSDETNFKISKLFVHIIARATSIRMIEEQ